MAGECPYTVGVFNVTGGELAIIMVVALIVLGPEKLPGAVRKFGQVYGELRRMSSGFQSELREAFDEPTRELRETVELAKSQLMGTFDFSADPVDEKPHSDGPQFASAAPQVTPPDAPSALTADASSSDAVSPGVITPGPSMQEQTIFEATYVPDPPSSNGASNGTSSGASDRSSLESASDVPAAVNGHSSPVSVAPLPAPVPVPAGAASAVRSPFAPPSGVAPLPGPLETPPAAPRSPFAPPLPPPVG